MRRSILVPLLPPLRLAPLPVPPTSEPLPATSEDAALAAASVPRVLGAFQSLSLRSDALAGLLQPFPPLS